MGLPEQMQQWQWKWQGRETATLGWAGGTFR